MDNSEWYIEYANDVACGFHEWYEVTNGVKIFKCDEESDAKWLLELLTRPSGARG